MQLRETVKRAYTSFLAVPTVVIGLFVLLAFGSYSLEQADVAWLRPLRDFMKGHVFGNPQATSTLLGTIAAGVITITSITFSLLLLALQQSAGSLTHQVFDQFLRRRTNQVYFGFFVGMTLFVLITLATVNPPFNPVFGATLTLMFTLVSLYALLLLIYATITQMRPTEIVHTIHDHTLRARQRQRVLIDRTRRAALLPAIDPTQVVAPGDGFIGNIDLDAIAAAMEPVSDPAEVVFHRSIGSFVAYRDQIAEVRTTDADAGNTIATRVVEAIRLDRQRDLVHDPAFGIEQLTTIAWRSISTSQQNPSPGLDTIHMLHDLLARWAGDESEPPGEPRLPVVYPDNVVDVLFDAFESLVVVASEAMQHQTYAAILHALETTFDRLPAPDRQRVEELLLRSLAALGDHLMTADLDGEMTRLVQTLRHAGRHETAAAIQAAQAGLASTSGRLNSRATRVPTA